MTEDHPVFILTSYFQQSELAGEMFKEMLEPLTTEQLREFWSTGCVTELIESDSQ